MHKGEQMIWMRRQNGGRRERLPLLVRVVGQTPTGAIVIERARGFRIVRESVSPRNLLPLPTGSVE